MNTLAKSWLRVGLVAVGMAACPFIQDSARAGDAVSANADEAAVMKADTDFCQLCVEKGMTEAFVTFAAEDGTILAPGMDPVKGKAAIREFYGGTDGWKLTWKPLKVEVARSGDLAYSYGNYELRLAGPDGKPKTSTGKYTTVWKKQPDGAWRYVLDIGTKNPAPAP